MSYVDLDKLTPDAIPTKEDDSFEFKSSKTGLEALKPKIRKAASAFSNSGGGCLICGVDDNGRADGGLPKDVKTQPICDWMDQVINQVVPAPKRKIRVYEDCGERGRFDEGKCLVAISFPESDTAPHQSPDGRYYIRAGAHSEPATHFIVEAITARRTNVVPVLRHLVRVKPANPYRFEIGIITVGAPSALDVTVTLGQFHGDYVMLNNLTPLFVTTIDRENPFFFEVGDKEHIENILLNDVKLIVEFKDIRNKIHRYQNERPLLEAFTSSRIGHEDSIATVRQLHRIANALEKMKR